MNSSSARRSLCVSLGNPLWRTGREPSASTAPCSGATATRARQPCTCMHASPSTAAKVWENSRTSRRKNSSQSRQSGLIWSAFWLRQTFSFVLSWQEDHGLRRAGFLPAFKGLLQHLPQHQDRPGGSQREQRAVCWASICVSCAQRWCPSSLLALLLAFVWEGSTLNTGPVIWK